MAKLLGIVTYVILNAGTPEFLINANGSSISDGETGTPISPSDPILKSIPASRNVLRIAGTVMKGTKKLVQQSLTLNALKYSYSETNIVINADGSVTVTIPEFKKGRNNVTRKLDAKATSVVQLNKFFAKPTAKVEASK